MTIRSRDVFLKMVQTRCLNLRTDGLKRSLVTSLVDSVPCFWVQVSFVSLLGSLWEIQVSRTVLVGGRQQEKRSCLTHPLAFCLYSICFLTFQTLKFLTWLWLSFLQVLGRVKEDSRAVRYSSSRHCL